MAEVEQIVDKVLQEHNERARVVAEALTWCGTPYHHMGRIKGAGVDCGMLLLEVFERVGLIPHVDPEAYPQDWAQHQPGERYLANVMDHGRQIEGPPQPGDIVLYKFGKCISHGAIVTQWPQVVHAYVDLGVVLDDAENNTILSKRVAGFWSVWGRK